MAVNVAMVAINSARLKQLERQSRRASSFPLLSSPRHASPRSDIGIKKRTTVMAYIPSTSLARRLLSALEHYLLRKAIPPTELTRTCGFVLPRRLRGIIDGIRTAT